MGNPEEDNYVAPYDSTRDIYRHKRDVARSMNVIINQLLIRAVTHDDSKLEDPEKAIFDKYTIPLRSTTYGSGEYKEHLKGMEEALNHHYGHNRHHPEHHSNGIKDMTIMDICEMIVDWFAATKKHADGDIRKSIEMNQERFGYSDDLKRIFLNTVDELEAGENGS